jgi:hypothetical protein
MKIKDSGFSVGKISAPKKYKINSYEEELTIMTLEEEIALKEAWEEYERGETISWGELKKELDEKWGLN